jgi:hypothetical protein
LIEYNPFTALIIGEITVKVLTIRPILLSFGIVFSTLEGTAMAQQSGQSIQIQYGYVVSSTYVQEKSNTGKAALIGGTVGYYANRKKSRSTRAASTAIGAGLAGGAKNRSEGSREAREYKIRTLTGEIAIISDQTEIHVDDCVVVENPGGKNANIRRVASTLCEAGSASVVDELNEELQEECASAKTELIAAETDDAVDRALRKVSILCDT